MFFDYHRACKGLTRPILEFGGWVAERYRPSWQEAFEEMLPPSSRAEKGLDHMIAHTKLRDVFISLRGLVELLELITSDPTITSPTKRFCLGQRMLECQVQLIDRYVDATSEGAETPPVFAQSRGGTQHQWNAHSEAYTCLAALWWTRYLKKEENVPAGPASTIYNAGDRILPTLKTVLMQSELISNGLESLTHGRVRLWALYIGSLSEQRTRIATRPVLPPDNDWFTRELMSQARKMHLRVWGEVREVLQGFLYSDGLEPHGSTWFVSE